MTYTTLAEIRALEYMFATAQSPDLTDAVLTTIIKKADKIVKADTEKVVNFTNIRKVNDDVTFLACYDAESITADYAAGWDVGRNIGSATVSAGYLNLNADSLRYIDYQAANNADSQQVGAVRCVVCPAYSGTPATAQRFFSVGKAHNSLVNVVTAYHFTNGKIYYQIYNSAAASIFTLLSDAVWVPVSGTDYELEIDWDITTGANRIFIDGQQIATADTSTGTRSADIGLLRVGSDITGASTSNFKISNLAVFNSVQHTENYTPTSCLYEVSAVPDFINLLSQYKTAEMALVYLYSRKRQGKEDDDIQYWHDMYMSLLDKVLNGEISLGDYSLGIGKFANTARNGVKPALGVGKWGGHYYKEDMQIDRPTDY